MPELPEVETIRRNLRDGTGDQPSLLGKTVASALVLWARTLALPDLEEFYARLPGQTITDIGRRGKFLVILLSFDSLLVHLRMSGDVRVDIRDSPTALHDRLLVNFTDNSRLTFNDPRKFGRVWMVREVQDVIAHLGPEPLDEQLTPQEFYGRLNATRRQLKPLLLDQTFLAGLGNIYTDEALNLAHLHPLIPANQVSPEQAEHLLSAIRQVLMDGIRHNGASLDWVYRGGEFQNYFRTYQRTGQPCPDCSTPIQRIVVGQRGTHYCPVCQTLT